MIARANAGLRILERGAYMRTAFLRFLTFGSGGTWQLLGRCRSVPYVQSSPSEVAKLTI